MIKCQICQHDNPDGAEYCEDCGASLSLPAAPPSTVVDEITAADAQATGPSTEVAPVGSAAPDAAAATGGELAAPSEPAGTAAPEAPAAAPDSTDAATMAPSAPSLPTTGQTARLVAHRYGAASGEEHPLLGDRLVVGRFDPETGPVDIDLSEAPEAGQISRHHAEVYREADGRWLVKDLGSTNGVFVKRSGSSTFGPRLTAPEGLTSGDEVAFGNARFIFKTD